MDEKNIKDKSLTPQQIFDDGTVILGKTLQIMKGKFGGGFYVRYLQDNGSKMGYLQLIVHYPNNCYKTILLCKNMFKETTVGADGIGEENKGTEENPKIIKPKLSESLKYGDYRLLEKYETPQMPIPAKAIWKQIIDNYHKIPIKIIYETEDVEGIYWELYRIAKQNYDSQQSARYRMNEVRFLVTKEEMEIVAIENGLTLGQLRTELNLLGLLVKDKGSTTENGKRYNSYQLTKKVDGMNKRFYALKLRIKPTETEVDTSCCVEFSENYLNTSAEIELEQVKKVNEGLKQTVENKEKELKEVLLNRVDDTTQEELYEHFL